MTMLHSTTNGPKHSAVPLTDCRKKTSVPSAALIKKNIFFSNCILSYDILNHLSIFVTCSSKDIKIKFHNYAMLHH